MQLNQQSPSTKDREREKTENRKESEKVTVQPVTLEKEVPEKKSRQCFERLCCK